MTDASPALTPAQLAAYFAFTEVSALLRPSVEKQLREAGGLSYVQFQLLARLGDDPEGRQRMTAQLLEQRGLVVRSPSPDDERSTVVAITGAGRDVLAAVFPGHIETVHGLLFAPVTDDDAEQLARILGHVSEHLRAAPPRSARKRTST
jgi:hypothetical protein